MQTSHTYLTPPGIDELVAVGDGSKGSRAGSREGNDAAAAAAADDAAAAEAAACFQKINAE